jgi:NF-X1-type zinc finger protein NFXL1
MLAVLAGEARLPTYCPPCARPLPVACVGGHGSRQLPCSAAARYTCGSACGRPLACGNHACALPCHAVAEPGAALPVGDAAGGPLAPRPCAQCTRRCEAMRCCEHACPRPCHTGACPNCDAPVRAACLCGKTSMSLPCHSHAAARAALAAAGSGGGGGGGGTVAVTAGEQGSPLAVLCCGKTCNRQQRFCSHPCKAGCHAGPCPGPESCAAEVGVRCACAAKRRAKWRCSEVQAALEAAGRGRAYDDAQHAPRVLPCDEECARAAAAAAAAGGKAARGAVAPVAAPSGASGTPAVAVAAAPSSSAGGKPGEGAAAAVAVAAVGAGGGRGKLSRAEREALAAEAAAAREAERRRKDRLAALVRSVLLAVLAGVVALVAWLAYGMLQRLDRLLAKPAPL